VLTSYSTRAISALFVAGLASGVFFVNRTGRPCRSGEPRPVRVLCVGRESKVEVNHGLSNPEDSDRNRGGIELVGPKWVLG